MLIYTLQLNGCSIRPNWCKANDMKKIVSTFVVLMMISSVVLAGGIENPSTKTSENTAIVETLTGVKVFYKSDKITKVRVTIYDEESKEVFSEEVKSRKGFIRPYNLDNLVEGDYRVVLEDENGTSEKIISNAREQVVVLASVVNARKNHGKCLVTMFTKGEADVSVKVLDANRNEIASESYRISGQSSKLFNLKDVKGAVFVEVSDSKGLIKSATIE